jgi:hypothetical protein
MPKKMSKGHMMPDGKMYYAKARGGAMARGGMARGGPAMSVGGDIGRWLGDWVQSWLGFADGGELPERPAEVTDAMLKELKKDIKADMKTGDFPDVSQAQGASIGGDIGAWLGDWVQSWLGFQHGGMLPKKKMGHSVFH